MKKWKLCFLVLLILLNSTMLSGCWNYKEISDLTIVTGLAIDKSEDKKSLEITFEVIDFKTSSQIQSTKTLDFTSTGKTVFDAVRNAIKIAGNKLYWGHAHVAIISEEIAKEDIIPVIDLMIRDHEMSPSINLIIAKGYTAKDILSTEALLTNMQAFEIDEITKNSKSSSQIVKVPLYEFLKAKEERGIEPVLPTITIIDNIEQKTAFGGGAAIFKDEKVVGFLNGDEVTFFSYVRNKIKNGLLLIKVGDKELKEYVVLEVFRSTTEVEPVFSGDKVSINIEVNTLARVNETPLHDSFITDKQIREIEQTASQQLSQNIQNLIFKVQQDYKTDIFGFGNLIWKSKPKVFEKMSSNWNERFTKIQVHVKAEVKLKSNGVYSKSLDTGE